MDYPEDPRFLQSPVVSTHTTPDKKDLSPPYQPDSSNIVVDLDVQTATEVEDEDTAPAPVTTFSDCPANEVDHIVDEQISGFSSEVEQLLRGNNIYYVSCLSSQSSREPPKTPVLPLSNYVSNFNTPFPVCNYISSFQDSLKVFIDSQRASGAHAAQDVSSSSSETEVTSNVPDTSSNINPCTSSSSISKPNTFESSLKSCSPTSALPDSMPQLQHRSSLPDPDVHEPPQKMWPLEQDSVCQKNLEANISNNHQSSHEINGSSVAEATEALEGQIAHPAVLTEDAPMEHAHSAISSIIDQLQPEVINNLVEILKGVQKNSVHFYIHSMDEEESDVCWEIKVYFYKLRYTFICIHGIVNEKIPHH